MSGRIHGIDAVMTRTAGRGAAACRRFGCLLMAFFLLWVLPGCGRRDDLPEFPPEAETVQAAAEELGWTLDPEGTQSRGEDQILYALETGEEMTAAVSCALAEGSRVLTETCLVILLPDKPQFAWEDWEKAVTLAETLYGGFSQGELYQALSEQGLPEPVIPPAGPNTPTGKESLSWEAELPGGYGLVRWLISAGQVEHGFPSPVIRDWRVVFSVSLYESREAYEKVMVKSGE